MIWVHSRRILERGPCRALGGGASSTCRLLSGATKKTGAGRQRNDVGKINPPSVSPFAVQMGGYCFPHPDKVRDGEKGVVKKHLGHGGEDAFFGDGTSFVGVADGIYEWRSKGIDAGLFSRSLMESAYDFCVGHSPRLEPRPGGEPYTTGREIFQAAENHVVKEKLQGSSTLCIFGILPYEGLEGYLTREGGANFHAMNHPANKKVWAGKLGEDVPDVSSLFRPDAMVGHCVNLGDSGVLVCRPSTKEVLFRTCQQEHSFGCPFQLGHEPHADTFSDADSCYIGGLKGGDMAIVGSDGLFDNLTDEAVVEICATSVKENARPQTLAMALVKEAFENSINSKIDTPYSLSATEEFSIIYKGGKKDDIAAVVAQLTENAP
jgi:protein phosphatase PTC7